MVGQQRFELAYGRGNRILMGVLGIGPRWSRLNVTDQHVVVRMGWAFRATIPIANITGVVAGQRPFIGWGVHGWRGNWLVNGTLRRLVTIDIDPPVAARVCGFPVGLRRLTVSLADDVGFLHSWAASHATREPRVT